MKDQKEKKVQNDIRIDPTSRDKMRQQPTKKPNKTQDK